MLDTVKILEDKIAFYNRPELIENPHHPAGFRGTWAFSDHSLIPEVLFGFLQRHFGIMRLRRISLDQINSLMNEVWEGPGSLEKIFRLEQEMIPMETDRDKPHGAPMAITKSPSLTSSESPSSA